MMALLQTVCVERSVLVIVFSMGNILLGLEIRVRCGRIQVMALLQTFRYRGVSWEWCCAWEKGLFQLKLEDVDLFI